MKSSYILFGLAGVVIAGVIAIAVVKGNAPSPYDGFAECLADSGAKMYGAWWCPHCKSQKELFGNAFKKINYLECSDANQNMTQQCKDEGVTGYPMWKFGDGSTLSGAQDFETLSEKSSCELPST